MIAQVVFDLPLEGPFDYLIPETMRTDVGVGRRVKVSFGPRVQMGFVVGVIETSAVAKLKAIGAVMDAAPIFNDIDLGFAVDFSAYYGCSVGEALAVMLRHKSELRPSLQRLHQPVLTIYRTSPREYAARIEKIMQAYQRKYQDKDGHYCKFLVLVPDSFHAARLAGELKGQPPRLATRSGVFDSDGSFDCVLMVDDQDASFKQEQSPMYETRQVLLMRARTFGFDVAFVGLTPSVELMALVEARQIKLIEESAAVAAARLVDLGNYKFVPGLISPPVRDAVEAALKAAQPALLVLNRRGSYRLTRCSDCGTILKCHRCDSPLLYSRKEGQYLCRHCTYTLPTETDCPQCHKPSWKSVGIGVEQVQTELKKIFPQAKIVSFERETKSKINKPSDLGAFQILIATQAVLRFQGRWQAGMAAFIDFDAELNRLDMRSGFHAFSLALHVAAMSAKELFIQTRNSPHYVLQSLSAGKAQVFYDQELKLRKEFGFSPYKHWIKLTWRGKTEKTALEAAQDVYNELAKLEGRLESLTPPLADVVGRKRGQFRFNVMAQTENVPAAVGLIKAVMAKLKRRTKVLVTINVDP